MNHAPDTFTLGTQHAKQLKFPVVAFHRDCIIVYRNIDDLTRMPLWSSASRYADSTLLLGMNRRSEYRTYKILDTRRVRSAANWRLLLILHVNVEFIVRDATESTSVDVLKSIILDDIKSNDIWDEVCDSREAASDAIIKCTTLGDIFDFFV
ncbi:MAG: hypothetical protein BGO49_04190 [Planctomycetales bacterium 71-10]|nr:MAG: hypothetical protein BGO49_04190 [Planctomycetales bacterium 71-10]